uniref:Methyltransf_11 domain-containing protein n=1 Tax=Heterorhabditis bacteriophora TaxID=37862 RepID=A0A1I7XGL5_HETBA
MQWLIELIHQENTVHDVDLYQVIYLFVYSWKVKFTEEEYTAMKKFEAQHHPDIWKWIINKVGTPENLSILDVSEEACVFALSLAESHTTNKLIIAARGDQPGFDLPSNVTFKKVDFRKNFNDIEDLGQFDVIILNEVTHEISDLTIFFNKLKALLKDGAPLVILSRPKNPPLPVPECCLMLWRKLAPTREEILAAAQSVHI